MYGGGISFFSVENDKIVLKWMFTPVEMNYDIRPDKRNFPTDNQETTIAYINVSVNDDKVYALFSGTKISEKDYYKGDEIHIFDYDGTHLLKLKLDQKVRHISVDESNEKLYAIKVEESGKVLLLVYDL